ncbi:hypothetical protein CIT292_06819 [Citrobacter youngae ATCC 29220]|uniref:Uncharacterized protein n=1 Tax=Citrobacter youngae ATCC 29220 TaxID=500640 RepID=D4B8N6_9ENTR|nr:hypothetical protein CIT292_06819 [Citrobacter youngae ATCC 29220]
MYDKVNDHFIENPWVVLLQNLLGVPATILSGSTGGEDECGKQQIPGLPERDAYSASF